MIYASIAEYLHATSSPDGYVMTLKWKSDVCCAGQIASNISTEMP
jgi:hypothetical protein